MTDDTQTLSIESLDEHLNFTGKYHQTVATLVYGELNPAYFGLTTDTMTDTIFFVDSTLNVNRNVLNLRQKYKKVFINLFLSDSEHCFAELLKEIFII